MQAIFTSIGSLSKKRPSAGMGLAIVALCVPAAIALGRSPSPAASIVSSRPSPPSATPAHVQVRGPGAADTAAQYLQFEPNQGQAEKAVRFVARGPRHRVEIFDDKFSLASKSPEGRAANAQLRFDGALQRGAFEAHEPAAGVANYLTASDSAGWIRGVPRYRQLRRANLYPGIDLVYYSREGELEFDLVVRPGADASRIRMHVDGSDAPVIAPNGDLLLDGTDGALRLHRPVLYQHIDGEKKTLFSGTP